METFDADWTISEDQRLSDEDMDEKKSMNTHLHILEAYTQLYGIWKNALLQQRLEQAFELFHTTIIDPDSGHMIPFFDETWDVRNRSISFGHEIEGAWLLCKAARQLGDAARIEQAGKTAVRIAARVRRAAQRPDGGIIYEQFEDGRTDESRHFWCQAEAMVGFFNAWQISRTPEFLQAAVRTWDFIEKYIIDRRHGDWFWKIQPSGDPDQHLPKVSNWKGPYHSIRACLEMMTRIDSVLDPGALKKEVRTYEHRSL
jgi:mannobiose 2-epimerase